MNDTTLALFGALALTDLNAMNLYGGWYYGAARDIEDAVSSCSVPFAGRT